MFFLVAVYNAFEKSLCRRSSGISGLAHISLLLAPLLLVPHHFFHLMHIALHPKHSSVLATGKKINSIPAETSIFVYPVHSSLPGG